MRHDLSIWFQNKLNGENTVDMPGCVAVCNRRFFKVAELLNYGVLADQTEIVKFNFHSFLVQQSFHPI